MRKYTKRDKPDCSLEDLYPKSQPFLFPRKKKDKEMHKKRDKPDFQLEEM